MWATAGIYIFFGSGPVSFWLLGNLEYRYPPLSHFEELKGINTIVVLAAYAEIYPSYPLSSEVNFASAFRIIEALRIYNDLPNAEILISGEEDMPEIMKKLLISLGVSGDRIAIENQSENTYESAVNVRKIVGAKSFILVTSAGHMPRAMGVFHKLAMNPIPAPTNYMTRKNYLAVNYFPDPMQLMYSDLAVHEYLGIFWYRLNDRL